MDNTNMALSYIRQAQERLKHAKQALSDGNYPYVIRQSQEGVELSLKACLRIVGIEPPKFHDVGPVLRKNSNLFPEWFREDINKVASISRMLRREREPSMYGDEELLLAPDEIYTFEDAEEALKNFNFIVGLSERLINQHIRIKK